MGASAAGGAAKVKTGKPVASSETSVARASALLGDLDEKRLTADPAYAAEVVRSVDLIVPSLSGEPKAAFLNLKLVALLASGEQESAAALATRLIEAEPHLAFYYPMAFLIHGSGESPEPAVALIERAAAAVTAAEQRSKLHEGLDEDSMFGFRRLLEQGKDQDRIRRVDEALVKLDWPGPASLQTRDYIRVEAAKGRLARGDTTGARELAAQVDAPDALLGLLTQRKYDGLFPAGLDRTERLGAAIAAEDRATAAALAKSGNDPRRLLNRVQFLRSVGREAEAVRTADPMLADMDVVADAGVPAFWVVNDAAFAMVRSGRSVQAVVLMKRLLALGVDEHPDLINMSINAGQIMVQAGMYAEAFQHASTIEKTQAQHASAYGKAWMAETAVCALAGSDRLGEADPWLAKLTADTDVNPAASTRALLCAGRLDEAERLILKRLRSDDPAGILAAVQDYRIVGTPVPHDKLLRERWDAVLARPAVVAEIEKVGRRLSLPLARAYWGRY